MTMPNAYGYSVKSRETYGLDPAVYQVHVGVTRRDGEALGKRELEALQAALEAARATDDQRPVAGEEASAKGQRKAATKRTSKPRKTVKATPRKAARRRA